MKTYRVIVNGWDCGEVELTTAEVIALQGDTSIRVEEVQG